MPAGPLAKGIQLLTCRVANFSWPGMNAYVAHTSSTKLNPPRLVRITGLVKRPDLNGAFGDATSFDAGNQRYAVTLEDDAGQQVNVKEHNLQFVGVDSDEEGQPPNHGTMPMPSDSAGPSNHATLVPSSASADNAGGAVSPPFPQFHTGGAPQHPHLPPPPHASVAAPAADPWRDPTIRCGDARLGGRSRTNCRLSCCVKQGGSESDEEWKAERQQNERHRATATASSSSKKKKKRARDDSDAEPIDRDAVYQSLQRRFPETSPNANVAKALRRCEKFEIACQGDDHADKEHLACNSEALLCAALLHTLAGQCLTQRTSCPMPYAVLPLPGTVHQYSPPARPYDSPASTDDCRIVSVCCRYARAAAVAQSLEWCVHTFAEKHGEAATIRWLLQARAARVLLPCRACSRRACSHCAGSLTLYSSRHHARSTRAPASPPSRLTQEPFIGPMRAKQIHDLAATGTCHALTAFEQGLPPVGSDGRLRELSDGRRSMRHAPAKLALSKVRAADRCLQTQTTPQHSTPHHHGPGPEDHSASCLSPKGLEVALTWPIACLCRCSASRQ